MYTHRAALVSDLLGDADLFGALRDIEAAGAGAVVYIPSSADPGADDTAGVELAVAARELEALGYRRVTLLDSRAPRLAGPRREIDLEAGDPPAAADAHGAPPPRRGRAGDALSGATVLLT